MITFFMPHARQLAVLEKAGYYKHSSIGKNGLTKEGYVLDVDPRTRWHAIIGREWLNIHQDRTTHSGYHVLNSYLGLGTEQEERKRLAEIHNSLFPHDTVPLYKMKMNVKKHGEYAPNLRELQKNHKTAIQSQDTTPDLSTGTVLANASQLA